MKANWDDRMQDYISDIKSIKGFSGENKFLSNFESCIVEYKGIFYASSESAYQAAKTLDGTIRAQFALMSASESKKAGRELPLREDWDKVKLQVMKDILLTKFTFNVNLKEKLLATGDKYLEETNWWGDTFWGVCKGIGENNLGKTLMEVREIVRNT